MPQHQSSCYNIGHDGDIKAKIYHNARCSKPCQALVVPREVGIEPEIIKHSDTPPTENELRSLIEAVGLDIIDVVYTKEAESKKLGLSEEPNDEELLDAMVSYPRLTERPFVVIDRGVHMARPTEAIEETS